MRISGVVPKKVLLVSREAENQDGSRKGTERKVVLAGAETDYRPVVVKITLVIRAAYARLSTGLRGPGVEGRRRPERHVRGIGCRGILYRNEDSRLQFEVRYICKS